MKTYQYAMNHFDSIKRLEEGLNKLGASGWRLVSLEWDAPECYFALVEKELEAQHGN